MPPLSAYSHLLRTQQRHGIKLSPLNCSVTKGNTQLVLMILAGAPVTAHVRRRRCHRSSDKRDDGRVLLLTLQWRGTGITRAGEMHWPWRTIPTTSCSGGFSCCSIGTTCIASESMMKVHSELLLEDLNQTDSSAMEHHVLAVQGNFFQNKRTEQGCSRP